MNPMKLRVPQLTHHVASGQDVVYLRGDDGKRRQVYCGPHGSAEAQRRYHEVITAYLDGKPIVAARTEAGRPVPSKWPTVQQLCAAYVLHAEQFYRDADGRATGEVTHALIAFRVLLQLHCETPTDRITIRDLLGVRQGLINLREQHEHGRSARNGLSRRTINDRIARIKRVFRWGVEQGIVLGAVWHELSALKGLPKGRCGVHDNAPVEAVPWSQVKASLKHMVPTVRAAVETQWWSGMRPAEVLAMTRRQLDTTGETWLYKPVKHKGSWRGMERVVALGPKAQAILRPRLSLALDAPLFSARTAYEEFLSAKREQRRTPPTKQTRDRDLRRVNAEPVGHVHELGRRELQRHVEQQLSRPADERFEAAHADQASPSHDAILREDLGLLDRALARLPKHYRDLIVRVHLCGEPRERVAAASGSSVDAMRNMLTRAMVKLAGELDRLQRGR